MTTDLNSESVVASRNHRKFRDGLTEVITMQVSGQASAVGPCTDPLVQHQRCPQLTCVDHVKKSDSDAVIFVYKFILSLEHLTHLYPKPTHLWTNIKHVTGKDKCSHRYLLQKLTINKQYKSITNKSCCIPSLLKPLWSLYCEEES